MCCVHLAVLRAVSGGLASSAHEWLLQRLGAGIAQRGVAAVALGRCVLRPWHLKSLTRAQVGLTHESNFEIITNVRKVSEYMIPPPHPTDGGVRQLVNYALSTKENSKETLVKVGKKEPRQISHEAKESTALCRPKVRPEDARAWRVGEMPGCLLVHTRICAASARKSAASRGTIPPALWSDETKAGAADASIAPGGGVG